jgi:zinc transporter, ZIP family
MYKAFLWGAGAAASLLIGYYLAKRGLSNRSIGMVMGFGAGALIAAIAYELIPESIMTGLDTALAFGLGALAFFLSDWLVDRLGGGERKSIPGDRPGGSGAAIFIGTLLDNIPESLILGMGIATGGAINVAFLSAVFVSNLPEGIAGTVNLRGAGYSRRTIFWMWVALVIVSGLAASLGFALISNLPWLDGRYTQAFAAGAMLTMLADAMMPEAFEHGGKLVGLLTVSGFLTAAILSITQ